MEYSIQKLDKSRKEIAMSFDSAEWDKHIEEAYKKNKHKFKLGGFRPGKVPFGVLVHRFGKEVFFDDAIDEALNAGYREILEQEKNFEPLGTPHVDIQECSEDGLKVVLAVDYYPEVVLGAYKGLKIEKEPCEVTEEEVTAALQREQENACRWLDVTDRAVQNGDRVILDYSGSINGVKFDGGTAEKQTLDIGSGMFIPGFEDRLVGMNLGEEKTIAVKFPENYGVENLKGKDADFAVKIHEIKLKDVPELDDEFAKDVSEFDTLAEYKADIKEKLLAMKKRNAEYAEENKLVEKIAEGSTVDLCDYLVEEEMDRLLDDFRMRLYQMQMRFEDYLQYSGQKVEDLRAERRPDAEKAVKSRLCIEAIIKAEQLSPTQEEIDTEIKKSADIEGKILDDYKKGMNEYEMGNIINRLMSDKLFKFLRENNTIA